MQVLGCIEHLVFSPEPGAIGSRGGTWEGEPVHQLANVPSAVCTPHAHPPVPTGHQPVVAVLRPRTLGGRKEYCLGTPKLEVGQTSLYLDRSVGGVHVSDGCSLMVSDHAYHQPSGRVANGNHTTRAA